MIVLVAAGARSLVVARPFDRRSLTVTLTLLPAVDVADGQAVRLVQGAAGSETGYGDPLEAALAWQRDGAEWIHLVDLDAAFGRGSNAELLADVVGRLDVEVELSGGIRDDESLRAALATGAARVNIGTAALEDPEWCDRVVRRVRRPGRDRARRARPHPARPAAGPATAATSSRCWSGWTRPGAARYVVTDITKDGTMRGPEPGPAARGLRAHRRRR